MKTNLNFNADQLINKFIQENIIKNGLTIPYIIGAYLYLEKKEYDENTIKECFEYFIGTEKYYNLSLCDEIDELVLSNINNEDKKIYLSNISIKRIGNIISTDNSLDELDSKKSLLNKIYNTYNNKLKISEFSKKKNEWSKISKKDLIIIDKITTANTRYKKWQVLLLNEIF